MELVDSGIRPAVTHLPSATLSIEIEELHSFVSVARNGNFGRAARELDLSPRTVTRRVQSLSKSVGASLVMQRGHDVALTPAGTVLLGRLDAIAHLLNAPLAEPAPADAVAGTVSFGLPAELAPVLLPPVIEAARGAWPRLRVEAMEMASADLEEATLGRRVDVAILQDPPAYDRLAIEPVVSDPLGLVIGAASALGLDTRPIRFRGLMGLPLILHSKRHWIRRRVENAAFQYGVRLEPVAEVDSLAPLKELVRYGVGCAILPRAAVQDELARGNLVFRAIEQPAMRCVHAVAVARAAEPIAAALAGLTRQVMAQAVRSGRWAAGELLRPVRSEDPTEANGSRRLAAGGWEAGDLVAPAA